MVAVLSEADVIFWDSLREEMLAFNVVKSNQNLLFKKSIKKLILKDCDLIFERFLAVGNLKLVSLPPNFRINEKSIIHFYPFAPDGHHHAGPGRF